MDQGSWSALQSSNQSTLTISPGDHLVYVRAYDQVDLVQTSYVGFVVDPYGPVVVITSPTRSYLSNPNVHLAWTATENLTGIVAYEVGVDSSPWVQVGLSTSHDLTLSEGRHLLQVRAEDQAGNYGTAKLNLTIDLTGPQVLILRPVNGTYVNQRNVVVEWNVTTNGTPLAYSEVRVDGALPWINVGQALAYTTPALAEGPHLIEIRSWDEAGNGITNSTSIVLDSIAPTVDWLYPPYGLNLDLDYVVMRWNMSDERSGLNTTFALVDSLAPVQIGLVHEYNVTNLTQGGHMIGVRVYDLAGNFHEVRVAVAVDLTPPAVRVTYPLEGQIIQGREINVMWTASDLESGLSRFYGASDSSSWVDLGLTYSHVFAGFDDGRHVVYIKAWDNAGNSRIDSVNFTVDFSQPVVTIQHPSSGGWVNSTEFTAVWTGSDTPLGMNHYEVRLDGLNWTNVGMNTTYHFSNLNYSAHVLEVKGVSNSSQETVARSSFGIDVIAPTSPTMVQPALYVNTGRISITWGASSDNLSGIGGYQVRTSRTYFNGTAYVTDVSPWMDSGTSLSYTSTGNPDGWYNVSVRAKDRAGNPGPEGTVQLILDSEPPRALSYSPVGNLVNIDSLIEVVFSEDMVQSSVRLHIDVSGNLTWEGNTSLRFIPAGALPYSHTYTVQVDGRDLAGNHMTALIWQFTTRPNTGVVTGKVVNELDAPIQGALVHLENGPSTYTNGYGYFSITAPSGNHTLVITYAGYSDFRVNVTLSAGDTTDIGSTPMAQAGTDFSWVIILTFVLLVAVAIELVYLQKKRRK